MLPTATTVGLMSTPPPNAVILPETAPNYSFTTTDSKASIVLFYRASLEKIYGPQNVRVDAQTPGLTVLRGTRFSLYHVWAIEQATVTISSTPDGLTHVDVKLDATPVCPSCQN
jgi:hypothetical protein